MPAIRGTSRSWPASNPKSQPRYGTPEQFPRLKMYASELDYDGKVAASCIHCHQVGESLHAVSRDEGKPIPTQLLFPYPHPKILGLVMDPKQRATIVRVESDSPAEKSGFRAGDKITSLNDQPILSTADIQWVLHNAAEEDELVVSIERGGRPMQLALSLSSGWRTRGDISWRNLLGPAAHDDGRIALEDLSSERRAESNIDDDELALEATHVGEYGEHAHAKRQGFRKGDVIVSIAGKSNRMRESDLFAFLVNRAVGEKVPVGVLRGEERMELSLSMQK